MSSELSTSPLPLPALADAPQSDVRVVLGRATIDSTTSAAEMSAQPLPLDCLLKDPVAVEVGGQVLAWGEPVVLDGKLAIRILRMTDAPGKPQEKPAE